MRGLLGMGVAALLWGSSVLAASPVARDFWMVPKTPVVASLEEAADIPVSLFSGDHFVADEEEAFDSKKIVRLALLHGGDPVALPQAPEGAVPFAHLRIPAKGGYLLFADRAPTTIEVPAATFEAFLKSEGLDAVGLERGRLGETGSPARERVAQHLKAFVEVASWGDESFDRPAGQELELLPGNDPVHMKVGGKLQMLVEFQGAPLRGKRVFALSRVGANVRSTPYTTDEHGMLRVDIDRAALWLIRTVHVTRCDGCGDADWQSHWATYVFESGGPDHETMTAPAMMAEPSRSRAFDLALVAGLLGVGGAIFAWRCRALSRGGGRA
jgi:hypothetical protein